MVVDLPILQQSVDAESHEWLMREQKRRKARSIPEGNSPDLAGSQATGGS